MYIAFLIACLIAPGFVPLLFPFTLDVLIVQYSVLAIDAGLAKTSRLTSLASAAAYNCIRDLLSELFVTGVLLVVIVIFAR